MTPQAAPEDERKRRKNDQAGRTVAEPRVESRIERARQGCIENSFGAERQRAKYPADRIDHGRNPGIGGAHQRQSFLDGADARLLQVLVGARALAEPSVIGEIEEPASPLAARYRIAGKHDLVA